jgi:hypothetical protein
MKALIRNPGETVTEADGIPGIDWNTGMPLTNPVWAGGPYRLVDNYVEVADGAIYDVAVYPEPEDPVTEDDVQDTIVIDGVTYTRTS